MDSSVVDEDAYFLSVSVEEHEKPVDSFHGDDPSVLVIFLDDFAAKFAFNVDLGNFALTGDLVDITLVGGLNRVNLLT